MHQQARREQMKTAEFWESAAAGELLVQECADCGGRQFYPRSYCVSCHGQSVGWTPASGKGEVYSYTVVRRAPSAEFADQVPYVLALVQLAEGPRLMVRLSGCTPDEVTVGAAVQLAGPGDAGRRQLPAFSLISPQA
jgi:uncharacterized OB-fold protein